MDANAPKVPSKKGNENTDVGDTQLSQVMQPIDNSNTIEEIVNTSNLSTDTIFGDMIEQNLPPEAIAALEKYKKAQSEHADISRKLVSLLKADPLDWDAINSMDSERTRLQQQRMDALEILALYSEEAFNELQSKKEAKIAAESITIALDEPIPAEERTATKENAAKIKRLTEEITELYKDVSTMTKEDLERGAELLNELEEERSKSK